MPNALSDSNSVSIPVAPWRIPLKRALHRNRALAHARYFQLATVRPDGSPANRTVVFRGFADGSDDLMMISDRRSQKYHQIQANSWGEVCWYFPKTREQFRLRGKLRIVDEATESQLEQAQRLQVWRSISAKAREQFSWPEPGMLRSNPFPQAEEPGQETSEAASDTVPGTSAHNEVEKNPEQPATAFCVIFLTPSEVDHLELKGAPQNRYRYDLDEDGGWNHIEVNP